MVLDLCEQYNIRFIFLPDNATHVMQPLDVAVFAPMKTEWKKILRHWKDSCERQGKSYPTLPKQAFPKLLRQLLEKDYSQSIISGFEATGLVPLNPECVLKNLPQVPVDVDNQMQQVLSNHLTNRR